MKAAPVHGTGAEAGKKLFVDMYEQWSSLFRGRSNWYDVTLVHVGGEYAPYTGRCEFTLALLGLSVTVTYVYDTTFNDEMQSISEQIRAQMEARSGMPVEDPTGALKKLDS